MTPTEAEIAWAAGIFEGEGTFSAKKAYGKVYPHAAVEMKDQDIVRRSHKIVRVGTWSQRKVRDSRYTSSVQDIAGFRALVDLLGPWLGTRRKARANQILKDLGDREGCATMVKSRRKKNGHV